MADDQAAFRPVAQLGFVTFGDLQQTLLANVTVWNAVVEWKANCGRIEPAYVLRIEEALNTGQIRAAGIDKYDGKLVWAPTATWRRPFRPVQNSTGFTSTTIAALNRESVPFPYGRMANRECYPMLSLRDLALLFNAKNPPSGPPQYVLDQILDIEVSVPSKSLNAIKPPKAKGGAPTQHDWDGFWIEVVCWAAENDLNREDRPKLKKLLQDWFTQNSENLPDDTTVDKKLSALFTRSAALLARRRGVT